MKRMMVVASLSILTVLAGTAAEQGDTVESVLTGIRFALDSNLEFYGVRDMTLTVPRDGIRREDSVVVARGSSVTLLSPDVSVGEGPVVVADGSSLTITGGTTDITGIIVTDGSNLTVNGDLPSLRHLMVDEDSTVTVNGQIPRPWRQDEEERARGLVYLISGTVSAIRPLR